MTKEELEREIEEKQEKLYESGVEERPTIMKQIRDEEAETLRHIKFCIKECEKKTGRIFPHALMPTSVYTWAMSNTSDEVTCD